MRPWTSLAIRSAVAVALALATLVFQAGGGLAAGKYPHGFSPLGELAYPPDFEHFAYVNPQAPKGGTLRLGHLGRFDSTNTLHYPGTTPRDLRIIYDTLLVQSADEPASWYGLLAESLDAAADFSSVTFHMRPEARWHDGTPITADDVVFTFEALKSQGAPFYRQAYRNITVTADDARTVTFRAGSPGDRQFVGRVGTMPIHPKAFWEANDWQETSEALPLGSGPYRLAAVDIGKRTTLERVEDYWAADLPVNVGRWNFDRIISDYFLDNNVALQAFLKGEFDLRVETDANLWRAGYQGPAVTNGRILRKVFPRAGLPQVQTFAFNLRRPMFQDRRMRKAMVMAFERSFVLDSLFGGLYPPLGSIFGDSELAARGEAGAGERTILQPFIGDLPDGILQASALEDIQARERRERLARADALLHEAGYEVVEGRRIDPVTGRPVVIEVVYMTPALDRVIATYAQNLKTLGIALEFRTLDPVTARRRMLDHDFDMTTLSWPPGGTRSRLPGSSESLLWGSALADRPGSYALPGAKDPALDAAIAAMIEARSPDQIVPAARAFDRVLRARHYIVPLWRSEESWVAHDVRLAYPPPSAAGVSPRDRWWDSTAATSLN